MKQLVLSLVLFCALPFGSVHAQGKETPHLHFVSTYIQQLGAIEKIRDKAAADLTVNSGANSLADCIRNMTSYQLELTAQIATLETMRLNPPFENVIENFTDFYEQKLAIYKRFTDLCSALITGPKPGVDYGALAAEAPKLNARLVFIDQGLFKSSPLVFAMLIDTREDAQGHVSHLIITKTERAKLIHDITLAFGDKLKQDNQNYTVSAASVLKSYLEKDYKCSDEPWN